MLPKERLKEVARTYDSHFLEEVHNTGHYRILRTPEVLDHRNFLAKIKSKIQYFLGNEFDLFYQKFQECGMGREIPTSFTN